MEFYREQTKHDAIMNKLHAFVTSEYAIYPNFGTLNNKHVELTCFIWMYPNSLDFCIGIVEFFEFIVTNPYAEAHTFSIFIDDNDLRVVTDSREWRHLKLLHQIYSQVEDNLFNLREGKVGNLLSH